jgi:hypothetical protein
MPGLLTYAVIFEVDLQYNDQLLHNTVFREILLKSKHREYTRDSTKYKSI